MISNNEAPRALARGFCVNEILERPYLIRALKSAVFRPRKYKIILFFIMGMLAAFIIEIKAAQEKTEYTAENLRDPFWRQQDYELEQKKEVTPLAAQPEKPFPALTVQGIIWDSKVPQAIINNKVLNLGDTISEARITDINKDGVTVSFYSREYNLSVAQTGESLERQKNTAEGNL